VANLQEIDLQVKKGEFVCIIGDVGAGKSSLISALIGDMLYLTSDQVKSLSAESLTLE
jgi:ABC-type uncharacterized transport system ATPase component